MDKEKMLSYFSSEKDYYNGFFFPSCPIFPFRGRDSLPLMLLSALFAELSEAWIITRAHTDMRS